MLNGLVYVASGFARRHFQQELAPRSLASKPPAEHQEDTYGPLQRLSYLAVIFFLFPLMIWTGLAMSPAVTSVFPGLVTVLGGHQCARTIHFFGAVALVLFLIVHIVMVSRAGFRTHVGAMIMGRVNREGK